MAVVQFSSWARMVLLCASYFLILGGFVDLWYRKSSYAVYIGIYCELIGAIIFILAWPWSIVKCLAYPFQNYWAAVVTCAVVSIPSFFVAPTCMGGGTLVLAAIFYAIASVRGESGLSWDQLVSGQTSTQQKVAGD